MKNAYQTEDPEKLLQLKRLEADALLDVLRTINLADTTVEQLSVIARNVLRAQLGVKKVTFFYEFEGSWQEGMRLGFEKIPIAALEEMILFEKTSRVTAGIAPHLTNLQVEYVVPIINRDASAAYFLVADFADSEMEAQNDLIFIETLGNMMSMAIRNRELINEKLQQESLRRELEVAESIQQQLLISDFTRFREFDVYGLNVPHHRIGGDYYDIIKRGKGKTFVCIADVAGKGIAAALLMSNLQASLRALCAQSTDLTEIIHELNRILLNVTQGERFVTLFLGLIDTELQTLSFINAGHNYPLLISDQGEVTELKTGTTLLGILDTIPIEVGSAHIESGVNLFMFTDGVVEQSSPGGDMFGGDRLLKVIDEKPITSSQALVNKVRQEVSFFADGAELEDDLTVLNVRF